MIHRFINADGFVSTGTGILGHNMFAYCDNNPINYSDSGGSYPTYSGRLVGGGTFSNVPTHQLGYLGQIEEYWQDGEIIPKTKSTKKNIHIYYDGYTPTYDIKNNNDNIIVYDKRHNTDNPDMQIFNSYQITDSETQLGILNALLLYDQENPSNHKWGRSVCSMQIEWDVHNELYYFSLGISERCQHVDLDYKDEGVTYWQFYKRAILAFFGG